MPPFSHITYWHAGQELYLTLFILVHKVKFYQFLHDIPSVTLIQLKAILICKISSGSCCLIVFIRENIL